MPSLKEVVYQLPKKYRNNKTPDFLTSQNQGDIPYNKYGTYEVLYFTKKNGNEPKPSDTWTPVDVVLEPEKRLQSLNLEHIPKPRNKFIIFKNHVHSYVQQQNAEMARGDEPNEKVSHKSSLLTTELIVKLWSIISPACKNYFDYLATLEDNLQQNLYPNYQVQRKCSNMPTKFVDRFLQENVRLTDKKFDKHAANDSNVFVQDYELLKSLFKKGKSSHYVTSSYELSTFYEREPKLEDIVEKHKNKYKALRKTTYCNRFSLNQKNAPKSKVGKKVKQVKTKKKAKTFVSPNHSEMNTFLIDPLFFVDNADSLNSSNSF